jgi:hypothetical protein
MKKPDVVKSRKCATMRVSGNCPTCERRISILYKKKEHDAKHDTFSDMYCDNCFSIVPTQTKGALNFYGLDDGFGASQME